MTRGVERLIAAATTLACLLSVPGDGALAQDVTVRGFLDAEVAQHRRLEDAYRAVPSPERLREYMAEIASAPHHAGAAGSRRVADYVVGQFRQWGLDAWIEEQEALMPLPVRRLVELVEPTHRRLQLEEPVVPEDPDSGDPGGVPTFNAYAADGDVTAELVYVNYGTPEDYTRLAELGIDVAGKIVIARYGRSWRGIKPKLAWERGAVGCLIYSDPRDDGYFQGDVYPEGPFRPAYGVQRGSVMDMPVHPGDPLTPGWGSEAGGRKLDRADAVTILKIPVLPISHADAQPLLEQLGGPVAPEDWRGALPLTYHVGPGPAKVRIALSFDWQVRPLYNVIARIEGSQYPDEWVIHGNHHDAWVNGATDPTSGNVALMETARGLATLLETGWRPKRTIVLASWDGEEWGLLGSTEWAEKHAAELSAGGVVYVNSDSNGKGWLSAGGSHSLQRLVNEVARDVPGPHGGESVAAELRQRRVDQAADPDSRAAATSAKEFPLSALGSGSDYTVFLDHLAVASLNLGFSGESQGGVYHSTYDSIEWYTRFSDGDFVFGRALSQIVGTLLLRLSDATVLPFSFGGYADAIKGYLDEIDALYAGLDEPPSLDLSPLGTALASLRRADDAYEEALAGVPALAPEGLDPTQVAELNRLLYTAERALRYEPGLPGREWFKHLIYAPGLYTGYGVKTLPGVREGIEQREWADAAAYVTHTSAAVSALAERLERAAARIEMLAR